jgi:hypothetical protein
MDAYLQAVWVILFVNCLSHVYPTVYPQVFFGKTIKRPFVPAGCLIPGIPYLQAHFFDITSIFLRYNFDITSIHWIEVISKKHRVYFVKISLQVPPGYEAGYNTVTFCQVVQRMNYINF